MTSIQSPPSLFNNYNQLVCNPWRARPEVAGRKSNTSREPTGKIQRRLTQSGRLKKLLVNTSRNRGVLRPKTSNSNMKESNFNKLTQADRIYNPESRTSAEARSTDSGRSKNLIRPKNLKNKT